MNAVRPIAVKLDQDTRDRLKRLADAKDRSTHWMLREEKREALQAWEEFQATGKHATLNIFPGLKAGDFRPGA